MISQGESMISRKRKSLKTLLGTILIILPFIVLLLIFIEGGIFGLFIYVLYLFAASCSTVSLIVGLLLIKNRDKK